jgi:hypothetical protein
MLMDRQNPQTGRTLSHLVFRARHTWQALRLRLRGYLASIVAWLDRLRDDCRSDVVGEGSFAPDGVCSDMEKWVRF